MTRKVYFTVFIAGIVVLWAALAINPHDRSDWLLENVLLIAGAIVLIAAAAIVLSMIGRFAYRLWRLRNV